MLTNILLPLITWYSSLNVKHVAGMPKCTCSRAWRVWKGFDKNNFFAYMHSLARFVLSKAKQPNNHSITNFTISHIMPSLPVEMWQAILEVSAATDRIRLRAVSKTLCELATPIVFHRLHFRNVPIDVKAFRNVQRSPEIVRLIEEISIIISDQEQLTWGTVGAL